MSEITKVTVSFRCVCEGKVDVSAAVGAMGDGPHTVRSNAGRTEHEGNVTIQAGSADQASAALSDAVHAAASDANTTCAVSIFSARAVGGAL